MKPPFKTATQIGGSIDDIMRLPCVKAAFKDYINGKDVLYKVRVKATDKGCISYPDTCACKGDWYVLTDEEYDKY